MDRTFEISTATIIKIILILLGLWFLYYIRDIVILFLVAVFLTALLEPAVDWLHKKKVARPLAVLFIFLIFFVVLGSLIATLIPQIIREAKALIEFLPEIGKRISEFASRMGIDRLQVDQKFLLGNLGRASGAGANIFSTTVGFISGLVSFVIALVLAFYMSVKEDAIKSFLFLITPNRMHANVGMAVEKIKTMLGKWMQAQLLLMLVVAILYLVAFLIIGVPYALVLALLGGILEIIPYAGPLMAGAIAVLFAFIESPVKGLLVVGVFFVVNQLENHVIVPQIMKKSVGLNPVAVILSLLVGAKLGGVVGMIMAVPVATAISVLLKEFVFKNKDAATA